MKPISRGKFAKLWVWGLLVASFFFFFGLRLNQKLNHSKKNLFESAFGFQKLQNMTQTDVGTEINQ